MAAELSCTCGPGDSVAGTRREVIEQRLAEQFGLAVHEVHALLDLLDRVNDAVLELPDSELDKDFRTTERRMAAESGRDFEWIKNFVETWESHGDELERELYEKHGPWGGLFGKRA